MIEIQLPETALDVPLSTEERSDLQRAEATIQRGQQTFIEVGLALADIRDRRLYRESHTSLEAYLRDRFPDLTRRHAYRLIQGAETASVVSHGTQLPAPTSERAVRPLTQLPAEQAQAVYAQAVAANGGAAPTGPQVEAALRAQQPQDGRCFDCGSYEALRVEGVARFLCVACATKHNPAMPGNIERNLIEMGRGLGYTITRHGDGYRIKYGDIPMGGAKNLPDLQTQVLGWGSTPLKTAATCKHCGISGAILISGRCESCYMLNQAKQHDGEEMRWRLVMALKTAKTMPEPFRRERIAEIRDIAGAHQVDIDAPIIEVSVAAPVPLPPPTTRYLDIMDIENIFYRLLTKVDDQEERLIEALLVGACRAGDDTEMDLLELLQDWLDDAPIGRLNWIVQGEE